MDFFLVYKEIYIAGITMDIAFFYSICFSQLRKLVNPSSDILKIWEMSILLRFNLIPDSLGLLDYIKVPADMARRSVKTPEEHNRSNHIIQIVIIKIPVFDEPADTPSLVHIHGNQSRIDASVFDNLLHNGLTTTLHQYLRSESGMPVNILPAIEFERQNNIGKAGLHRFQFFNI